ncbi:restriction endonuclease subunit S [Roseiflexus sp. RS-1]|uniref:restriction endonuclease subunit S n=1 Tax=Roseiflexus sp. (strain RS-1) TaxID=357808 RepID=UPI0000D81A07|nr:restriction endonuclease subunit S [Roseiflexus sp. RS-1]ABQ89151.1 restriction modification system DNA specificity domain [Roseiflexus sp. RS-1]
MMERWELPKGWGWKRLKTLVTVNYGKGLSEKQRKAGNVPVYGANGVVGFHDTSITKGQTIVIGRKGSAGAVNWSEIACWPIDTTFFIDEFPEILYPQFLYQFLRSQQIDRLQQSAAIPGLNRDVLYSVEVPIPYPDDPAHSLAEQRRIVARLELLLGETRAMREDIQAMRRDLAQVMESALAEVFPNPNGEMPKGWGWKSIDDLFELQQGASMSPRRRQGRNPQPFLRTKNILWGEVDTSDVDVMDFTEDEIERLKLRKGDLLICEGGDVGRAAVWEDQLPLVMYQNHIHRLRRKSDDADPKFYVYWMKAAYQLFKIYQGEESRTAIPNLSGRRLKNFLVPTTSLTEQRRIVAYLEHIAEEIRAMDDLLAQDLRDIEVLEQSILAAAFRGEV